MAQPLPWYPISASDSYFAERHQDRVVRSSRPLVISGGKVVRVTVDVIWLM